MPIAFPTLALGGDVRVPIVNGDETVKVPAGTQPAARFKLRGKGMPNVSGRGHGDLYVIARVAVPKRLTKEQRRLLEELAKTLPQEPVATEGDGAERPFFEKVKDIFG
jgi:molecular chaperone DnaJ